MASRVSPAQVAAAIDAASANVPVEKLAERVAEYLRAERLVSRWPAIAARLRRLHTPVTVTVAQPLGEAAAARLAKQLGPVEVVVNPALLGGAVVRRGDVMVDRSFSGSLAAMSRRLAGRT